MDDRSSAVSLPEVPLLGVLPGTGGLTRVVDKRYVRRDLADHFSSLAEGVRGRRAVEWRLIDATYKLSKFEAGVRDHVDRVLESVEDKENASGIEWTPLEVTVDDDDSRHYSVSMRLRKKAQGNHYATARKQSTHGSSAILQEGAKMVALSVFRQLDDCLLHLRFNLRDIGCIVLKTRGRKTLSWPSTT